MVYKICFMKKIQIYAPGGYEQLKLIECPIPDSKKLADDEVLVQIYAAGVNYADVCVRWGLYASAKKFVGWPITPGFEFSGFVRGKGNKVRHFEIGDSVLGITFFGGYSEWIVVKAWQLYALRSEYKLTMEQAAGIPAVFLTAYHALYQNVVTRPRMNILIHSAAGGVGQALVQLAHLLNFDITAVVGRSEKVAFVKDILKAHHVIDKTTEDIWEQAQRIAPKGYDLILDANGIATLRESYRHLAPMGKLIIYGFHSMLPRYGGKLTLEHKLKMLWYYLQTPRFNPLFMTNENKSIITFNLSFLFFYQELYQQAMDNILKWFKEKKLIAPPIQTYPLEEVAHAHRDIESGTTQGKLILCMNHNSQV